MRITKSILDNAIEFTLTGNVESRKSDPDYMQLLEIYFNDKNSSKLRESVTAMIAGFEVNDDKLGYDVEGHNIEVKPQNVNGKEKLGSGRGNFTDYTWSRFEKDKDNNITMLISGFTNGRIVFALSFPFNHSTFLDKLRSQLEKRLPDGDKSGQYVRGASFSYTSYRDCKDVKLIYLNKELKDSMTIPFFKFLESLDK